MKALGAEIRPQKSLICMKKAKCTIMLRFACMALNVDIGFMMNARSSTEQEFHRSMLFTLLPEC